MLQVLRNALHYTSVRPPSAKVLENSGDSNSIIGDQIHTRGESKFSRYRTECALRVRHLLSGDFLIRDVELTVKRVKGECVDEGSDDAEAKR